MVPIAWSGFGKQGWWWSLHSLEATQGNVLTLPATCLVFQEISLPTPRPWSKCSSVPPKAVTSLPQGFACSSRP